MYQIVVNFALTPNVPSQPSSQRKPGTGVMLPLVPVISGGANVAECGRRPTDGNRLQAIAAAKQRRQHLDSTRDARRARARERTLQHTAPDLHGGDMLQCFEDVSRSFEALVKYRSGG
eukprot:42411-Pelagomonas_calceolata.AAC.1